MRPASIALIAGARPNFVKAAPILRALAAVGRFHVDFVHTGQHYGELMSDAFFTDLQLPEPQVYLGVGSGTHGEQTARIMIEFERYLGERQPSFVIVIGDVNSTLGSSVVAAKAGVPIAHVEAGLRSFDRSMPEEINRIVTDALAAICLTTSADADEHLRAEGHDPAEIYLVGNTMVDTLEAFRSVAADPVPLEQLGLTPQEYILVTLHRPSNVDDRKKLGAILDAISSLPLQVVFPVHPRTRAAATRAGLAPALDRVLSTPPLGYIDFMRLQTHARLVLTDSGGIQEETTMLGVRCLTFRQNTERPVTITDGTNRLIGDDPASIGQAIEEALHETSLPTRRPPLWDGHAAERIAVVLDRLF